MQLILIAENSPEWDYMWNWLANHPLNEGIENPSTALNEGEAWQYMHSLKQGERVIHSFRHRNHPRYNRLSNLSVVASENFTPDQIMKK